MSAERLTRALAEQVRRFAQALGRARRGDVTGVHQARVASRRIREILPLVDARRLNKDVRRVASGLGGVRELDVTRGFLLAAAERHNWRPALVDEVAAGLEADRVRRHAEFVEVLQRIGSRTLLRSLRRAVAETRPDDETLETELNARLRKRAAELASSLRELGTLYVPDRLHAVRLAAKKLRYSLEARRDVHRAAVAGDIRTLTNMQEHLGQLHDLQMLQARLRSASRDADRGEVRRMIADLERECRALHARVVARSQAWLRMADRITRR